MSNVHCSIKIDVITLTLQAFSAQAVKLREMQKPAAYSFQTYPQILDSVESGEML